MSDLLSALVTLTDYNIEIDDFVDDLLYNDCLDTDEIKLLSLFGAVGVDAFEAEATSYDDCVFCVGKELWLVVTEDEKDERWNEALDSYLDECVEGSDGPYFDRESWKRDARMDGFSHCIGSYDGNEIESDGALGWLTIVRIG